jgi:intracellular proteinase inhibitor BsuPI
MNWARSPRIDRGYTSRAPGRLPAGSGLFLLALLAISIALSGVPSVAATEVAQMNASADTLRVTLLVPARVHAGDSVSIVIKVENVTNRRLNLSLQGRQIAFDILITTAEGKPVWRRLENRPIQSILQMKSLAPGESFELRDTWRATTPGNYLVAASIPTDAVPITSSAPARLQVVSRK